MISYINLFSQSPVYYEGYISILGISFEGGKARFSDSDLRKNFGTPLELGLKVFYFDRKSHYGLIINTNYLKKTQKKEKNAKVSRFTISIEAGRCSFFPQGNIIIYISGGILWGWRKSEIIDLGKEKINSNFGFGGRVGGIYRFSKVFGILGDIQIIFLKMGELETGSISYKGGFCFIFK